MSNDPKSTPLGEEIEESIERTEDPQTLAEATTAELSEKALGGHASGEADKTSK